jgi:hypothetical protein
MRRGVLRCLSSDFSLENSVKSPGLLWQKKTPGYKTKSSQLFSIPSTINTSQVEIVDNM